jgi:hypothetical protein
MSDVLAYIDLDRKYQKELRDTKEHIYVALRKLERLRNHFSDFIKEECEDSKQWVWVVLTAPDYLNEIIWELMGLPE